MQAITGSPRVNEFFTAASQQISALGGRAVALLPKSPLARKGTIVLVFAVGLIFLRKIAHMIYDISKARARSALIAMADKDPTALRGHMGSAFDSAFRDDEKIAKLYLQKDPICFLVLSERLKDNKDIALFAIKQNHAIACAVGPNLKKDRGFISAAIGASPYVFFELVKYNQGHEDEYLDHLRTFLRSPKLNFAEMKPAVLFKIIFGFCWADKTLMQLLLGKIAILDAYKQDWLKLVNTYMTRTQSPLLNDPDITAYFKPIP